MKPITEYTHAVSKARQVELCQQYTLSDCNDGGRGCLVRKEVNALLRQRYHRNLERSRASRRKAAIPPDQYERKREYMRRYYQENREVILMKQKARQ